MIRIYNGDGFTVQGEGMHGFRYSENNRSAILDGERLAGSGYGAPDFVLYSSTAGWEDEKALSDDERVRIVGGIGEALR